MKKLFLIVTLAASTFTAQSAFAANEITEVIVENVVSIQEQPTEVAGDCASWAADYLAYLMDHKGVEFTGSEFNHNFNVLVTMCEN